MDQLAISCGGIVGIDFLDFEKSKVENISLDFVEKGFAFVIV